jgi:hypothetical protein
MKLKTDDNGQITLYEGKPVYVYDDGKEIPFDAPQAFGKIKELGEEAKNWRLKYEDASKNLTSFEGINPDKAREALEALSKIDQKKLIDAGEVDKVKLEITKAMEQKQAELHKYNEQLQDVIRQKDNVINQEIIGGSFLRSKFITDRLNIPPDIVQYRFGPHFAVKEGKPVAKDQHGNEIYSKQRPGELADFEEAIEIIINNYPHKDSILKGSGASGSGNTGTTGYSGGSRMINANDAKAFGANLERIAKGEVQVMR